MSHSEKIGFYGGKFFPFHLGHLEVMLKASSMVDKLYVVVFHDKTIEKELLNLENGGGVEIPTVIT